MRIPEFLEIARVCAKLKFFKNISMFIHARRVRKNNKTASLCTSGKQTEHSARSERSSCVLGDVAQRKAEIREA